MNQWEIMILQIIHSLGGRASTRQIYNQLEQGGFLNEKQLRETAWQGRPAYQHGVRSHLSNLTEAGDLERISRAMYVLTEQGIKRVSKGS